MTGKSFCLGNEMTAQIIGNFIIGKCFCDVKCIYGHKTRIFNIGRGHYVVHTRYVKAISLLGRIGVKVFMRAFGREEFSPREYTLI